jgi:hypothetical protein
VVPEAAPEAQFPGSEFGMEGNPEQGSGEQVPVVVQMLDEQVAVRVPT